MYYFIQGSHIKIKTTTEIPVQVDGEPWLQPAGDIVVLKSALKVCQFLSALCWMESMVIWVVEFPREGYKKSIFQKEIIVFCELMYVVASLSDFVFLPWKLDNRYYHNGEG